MDRDSRQSQLKSQPKHIHPSRELRLNIVQCLSQVGKVLVNNTQNTVQDHNSQNSHGNHICFVMVIS